jgi:hypothetical protein
MWTAVRRPGVWLVLLAALLGCLFVPSQAGINKYTLNVRSPLYTAHLILRPPCCYNFFEQMFRFGLLFLVAYLPSVSRLNSAADLAQ